MSQSQSVEKFEIWPAETADERNSNNLVSLLFSLTKILLLKPIHEESIKYFDEFEYCLIVLTWCVSSNWPEKCPMRYVSP